MPELPEAECIGRALNRVLPGRAVVGVEIFSPAMREPLTPLADAGLEGAVFGTVRRRGRYLVAPLSDGRALLMHFGMSGVVRVEPEGRARRRHEHLFLHLSGGMVFKFECTRRFSVLKLCTPGADGWPPELAALGPEPLSEAFDGAYLYRVSRKRTGNVKNFIMNNRIVAGIGNIYAAETFFAAGVSPLRSAGSLTRAECAALAAEAKRILRAAIELGGSTIADFRNVDGTEGKFAQELSVYGREGQPCPRCGTTLRKERIGGRGSCLCPACQK